MDRFSGLWKNYDFVKLWTAQTVSTLGTLMGALQFTAVLALNATPFQMGALVAINVAPGLFLGLIAGVWIDRLRRRPILIIADIGRAGLIGSLPIAYLFDTLTIWQLYVVSFGSGLLTMFFDVAYRSYLPSLVSRSNLVDANSKLSAIESVVEVTAFSIGGWIAQLAGSLIVAAIDAFSFLFSGIALALIRKREPEVVRLSQHHSVMSDIRQGLVTVWNNHVLRVIGGVTVMRGLHDGVFGAVILLFVINGLGIQAGVFGTIAAVGGISAFVGAMLVGPLSRRYGIGPVMTYGLLFSSLTSFLIPLARGPLIVVGGYLVASQLLGDGARTAYEINEVSLRQSITSNRMLGRVNASLRVIALGSMFTGSLMAGALGEAIGLRATLAIAAGFGMLAWLGLMISPLRTLKHQRETPDDNS